MRIRYYNSISRGSAGTLRCGGANDFPRRRLRRECLSKPYLPEIESGSQTMGYLDENAPMRVLRRI
jgi:hypothetical protein